MDKRAYGVIAVVLVLSLAAPVFGGWPGDAAKCKKDMVKVGSTCIDTYEASVWEIPAVKSNGKSNKGLVTKVQNGTAKLEDLTAGEAIQRGVSADDYPCADDGQNCSDRIYALSLPGVTPSAYITWFQMQQACENSRKRLPSNDEWQAAVAGTQDPGGDNGTTDCTTSVPPVYPTRTGERSSCKSAWGAYDMVGNLAEWVADWMPPLDDCLNWGGFSSDEMCLSGDAYGGGRPGVLLRGGAPSQRWLAGPLAITGVLYGPLEDDDAIGFRCAR